MEYKRELKLRLLRSLFPNINYNVNYVLTYSKLYDYVKSFDTEYQIYLLEAKITSYERKYDLIRLLASYDLLNKVRNKDEI